jgi:hypothetical protein
MEPNYYRDSQSTALPNKKENIISTYYYLFSSKSRECINLEKKEGEMIMSMTGQSFF